MCSSASIWDFRILEGFFGAGENNIVPVHVCSSLADFAGDPRFDDTTADDLVRFDIY